MENLANIGINGLVFTEGLVQHEACVIGDTVGDPFKDTSSVSLNPIIKFSTLFGLLATEIALNMKIEASNSNSIDYTAYIGAGFLVIALIFVWRSFYKMRIPLHNHVTPD